MIKRTRGGRDARSGPVDNRAGTEALSELPPGSGDRVLRQVASWLLPGAGEIDPLADRAEAEALVSQAVALRLLGPLLVAIDAGSLDLDDDLVEQVVVKHQESLLWCMAVEIRLLEVRKWFADAGEIEHLVLKGSAVAHLDDVDPSLRSFADLDLLVHGRDMDRALAALTAHGAVRRMPERRPGFDRRFVKSVALTCPDDMELDVHRSLCDGAYGFRIPLDRLFATPDRFELGGEWVPTLNRPHRALHAAYHAMVASVTPPLHTLRDMAGYLTSPDLPPEVLAEEAQLWRGETVLAEAVRATFDTLSFEAPAWRSWLATVSDDAKELALIRRMQVESAKPFEWSTVRELNWRERSAFLWAVAVPSAVDLQARGLTNRSRVVQGMRRLIGEIRSGPRRW